jgi:hypothetical protein
MTAPKISKTLQAEVFRRDSFTCQYCGAKAPDVVLEVDEIPQISKVRKTDLSTLLTSCQGCLASRSPDVFEERSPNETQSERLDNLQKRKEQSELLFDWQKELLDQDHPFLSKLADYWSELLDETYSFTENGKTALTKLLSDFSFDQIMKGMKIAVNQYVKFVDGTPTQESVELAWNKVPGICYVTFHKPHLKNLYYIRGIARNKCPYYFNDEDALQLLEAAYENGSDVDTLKKIAKQAHSWSQWRSEMYDLLNRE